MSEIKEQLIADITLENGLTEKENLFLDLLFDEYKGDVRKAMEAAGYPKSHPTNILTKKLSKEIAERSKNYLIVSSGKAAISLVGVLDDPTALGAKQVIAASKEILDRAGVYKEEGPKVIEQRNMFILPAKEVKEIKDITPSVSRIEELKEKVLDGESITD